MSETKSYVPSPGSVRPSQLITTFGPGSLIQTEHDSVIVLGIDYWFNKKNEDLKFDRLSHPFLEAKLGVDHFKTPTTLGKGYSIPCKSFPSWGVCLSCYRMQKHSYVPKEKTFRCDHCKRKPNLSPSRFITICENGHLDEFPWVEWAHSTDDGAGVVCENPKLKFWADGKKQSLSDYIVKCDTCGKRRNCGAAVSEKGLEKIIPSCNGSSPWLGTSKKCVDKNGNSVPVRGIQVRATNIHFPVITSSIFIPEWIHPIQDVITAKKETILDLRSANPPMSHEQIATQMPFFEPMRNEFGVDEIVKHLDKRFKPSSEINKESTEKEIRDIEYSNLEDSKKHYVYDKKIIELDDVAIDDELSPYLDKLTKLKRITEVKVLRAFTRNLAPDPYSSDKSQKTNYCNIFKGKKPRWLPAVENKGEGIFFVLNKNRLKKWSNDPKVKERCLATIDGFEQWAKEREWEVQEQFEPRYLLLHTLSHALIRELANSSGYGESSIQERIYSGKEQCGILLYTSTSSSDGSLGGLVRKGDADKFSSLLTGMQNTALRCSRDPLCSEDDPIKKKNNQVNAHARINGSACYGCTLLPETSCENFNKLLDRMLLSDPTYGFFSKRFD